MAKVEHVNEFMLVSVPVNKHGEVTLRALRDLCESTDSLPETTVAVFVNGELRVEISQ